jgi:hypothetical protein
MHLFGRICDHDYYCKLLRKEEQDAAINYSVFYFSPSPDPGCPACEPNFFTCS